MIIEDNALLTRAMTTAWLQRRILQHNCGAALRENGQTDLVLVVQKPEEGYVGDVGIETFSTPHTFGNRITTCFSATEQTLEVLLNASIVNRVRILAVPVTVRHSMRLGAKCARKMDVARSPFEDVAETLRRATNIPDGENFLETKFRDVELVESSISVQHNWIHRCAPTKQATSGQLLPSAEFRRLVRARFCLRQIDGRFG